MITFVLLSALLTSTNVPSASAFWNLSLATGRSGGGAFNEGTPSPSLLVLAERSTGIFGVAVAYSHGSASGSQLAISHNDLAVGGTASWANVLGPVTPYGRLSGVLSFVGFDTGFAKTSQRPVPGAEVDVGARLVFGEELRAWRFVVFGEAGYTWRMPESYRLETQQDSPTQMVGAPLGKFSVSTWSLRAGIGITL